MSTLARIDNGANITPGTPDTPAYTTEEIVYEPGYYARFDGPLGRAVRYWARTLVTVNHPAVPGTPDVVHPDPPDGWDATARSTEPLPEGNARLTFNIPAGRAPAAIGLVTDETRPLPELFRHGFVFADDAVWRWLDWKAPGAQPLLNGLDVSYGFALAREDGRLRLTVQDIPLWEGPDPFNGARAWVGAALYAEGAEVRNAKVAAIPADGVAGVLEEATLFSTDGDAWIDGMRGGRLGTLTLSSRSAPPNGLDRDLAALQIVAGDMRLGDTLPQPAPASGVRAALRALVLRAGVSPAPIDPGEPTEPPPAAPEPVFEQLRGAVVLDIALDAADGVPLARLGAAFVVDIRLAPAEAVPVEVLPAAFRVAVALLAHDPSPARLDVGVVLDIPLIEVGAGIDTWAVNIATSGSTRYVGFPFNSLARIGNRYFGAGNLGVCELRGHTDAGADIDALMDLGDKDFGTPNRKVLVEAFVSMAGTAPLLVDLHAEGATFTYQTDGAGPHLKEQRVKFGKGRALQTTFINPVIRNQRGADFQIDALQFGVQTLSRKL